MGASRLVLQSVAGAVCLVLSLHRLYYQQQQAAGMQAGAHQQGWPTDFCSCFHTDPAESAGCSAVPRVTEVASDAAKQSHNFLHAATKVEPGSTPVRAEFTGVILFFVCRVSSFVTCYMPDVHQTV